MYEDYDASPYPSSTSPRRAGACWDCFNWRHGEGDYRRSSPYHSSVAHLHRREVSGLRVPGSALKGQMAPEADTRLKPRLKSGGAGETTVLLSWKPQSNEPHNPTFEPRYLT